MTSDISAGSPASDSVNLFKAFSIFMAKKYLDSRRTRWRRRRRRRRCGMSYIR